MFSLHEALNILHKFELSFRVEADGLERLRPGVSPVPVPLARPPPLGGQDPAREVGGRGGGRGPGQHPRHRRQRVLGRNILEKVFEELS